MSDNSTTVTIYGAEWCPPCHAAKDYLKSRNIKYDYVNVDHDPTTGREVAQKTGWTAIPIIKIGETYILGFDRPKIDEVLDANNIG